MIPVFQTMIDRGKGDCWRAVVASLFELDISQVPHFLLYDNQQSDLLEYNENKLGRLGSANIYWNFIRMLGWEWNGSGYPHKDKLELCDSVDGFFHAIVKSKTFENINHCVVVDINGVVVHDPNPNKAYLNINVLNSGDLQSWYLLSRHNG